MWTSARPPSAMGMVASRHAADSPRASDGLLTGGGRAGIRLMPTFCDIPRWAVARRRTCHGRETDTPRAYHRRFPYGRATDVQRAAHGLAYGLLTDGRRAGFGQTWTSPDVPRWAAADCAAHGLETDWRRVRDNARGCLRTLRVRLTPNLPSESIRFLRHIYHEYAQLTTHGRATDFPYRTSSSPSSPLSPCSNQELR